MLKATGTDNTVNGLNKSAAYAQQSGRDSGQTGATGCDDEAFKPASKKAPKPLCFADLGEEVQASATDCDK